MANTVTLDLKLLGIKIAFEEDYPKNATLVSDMREEDTWENKLFNAAIDGLESMILAQWVSGVDVCCDDYLDGVKTAYESIGNQMEELPKLRLAAHLEGGLIQSVQCEDRDLVGTEIHVYDYDDLENVDEEDLIHITQPDGEKAEASKVVVTASLGDGCNATNASEVFGE